MSSIEITTYSTTTISSKIYVTKTIAVPIATSTAGTLDSSGSSTSFSLTFGTAPTLHAPFASSSSTQSPASSSNTAQSNATAAEQNSEFIGKGGVSHPAAIAGGITGTFATLVVIGLLAFLLLRRRKKRESEESPRHMHNFFSSSRRATAADDGLWKEQPRHVRTASSTPRLPPLAISSLPMIDNNLIRMSLHHWDRPYAVEDPFRDISPASLHLVNPDPSTPGLPTASSTPAIAPGFLQRQRSALAVALLNIKHSISAQSLPQHQHNPSSAASTPSLRGLFASPPFTLHPPPPNNNPRTVPSEVLISGLPYPLPAHSSRSSLALIRQHPPDDPFLVPSPLRIRHVPSPPTHTCAFAHDPGHICPFPHPSTVAPLALRTPRLPSPLQLPLRRRPVPTPLQTVQMTRSRSRSPDESLLTVLRHPRAAGPGSWRTRSEESVARGSIRSAQSGPFDLATESIVRERSRERRDREMEGRGGSPNWVVHAYSGT